MKNNNRYVCKTGKRLDFCLLDKERHLDNYLNWFNDPEITKWMLIGLFPVTKNTEEEWFDKQGKNENDVGFAIESKEGKHLGGCGIHKIDWKSKIAEGGIVIGDKTEWGKGYATEAEKMMLDYGFSILGLRKISAHIFRENIASLKAAIKNGLKKEGVLKKHLYKNGKYNDLIILSAFQKNHI